MPIKHWLRNELKSWAQELISDSALLDELSIDRMKVMAAWKMHQAGKNDNSNMIWALLMYLIWSKKKVLV